MVHQIPEGFEVVRPYGEYLDLEIRPNRPNHHFAVSRYHNLVLAIAIHILGEYVPESKVDTSILGMHGRKSPATIIDRHDPALCEPPTRPDGKREKV